MNKTIIPKKQVFDSRTGSEYKLSLNWVNPEGKSPWEILTEIKSRLDRTYGKPHLIEELLDQAVSILQKPIDGVYQEGIFKTVNRLSEKLAEYYKLKSKKQQRNLIMEIIKEYKLVISMNDPSYQ